MTKYLSGLLAGAMLLLAEHAAGQSIYVATNLVDYLNLATINAEVGISPWAKWSFYVKGRYNPFEYRIRGKEIRNKTAGAYMGGKHWFWYSNAGWYLGAHAGYCRFNSGGILDGSAYEGDAGGLTVYGGYALLLSRHWNLEFALGVQGGYASYTKYLCPVCGQIEGEYKRFYAMPSNVLVQLTYVL